MQGLGTGLLVVGAVALGVGLLGLLSMLLRRLGIEFRFVVDPWYGPLLGGLALLVVGRLLRRRLV
jgi:tetrahydromethanopterin S-methyltransferase subunit C